jgi:hypothetical protein
MCEREKNKSERVDVKKELSRIFEVATDGHLIREPHGTSWLKDRADVAIPRRSPRKEVHENQEDPTEGRETVRLFGTNSPKKAAV